MERILALDSDELLLVRTWIDFSKARTVESFTKLLRKNLCGLMEREDRMGEGSLKLMVENKHGIEIIGHTYI